MVIIIKSWAIVSHEMNCFCIHLLIHWAVKGRNAPMPVFSKMISAAQCFIHFIKSKRFNEFPSWSDGNLPMVHRWKLIFQILTKKFDSGDREPRPQGPMPFNDWKTGKIVDKIQKLRHRWFLLYNWNYTTVKFQPETNCGGGCGGCKKLHRNAAVNFRNKRTCYLICKK